MSTASPTSPDGISPGTLDPADVTLSIQREDDRIVFALHTAGLDVPAELSLSDEQLENTIDAINLQIGAASQTRGAPTSSGFPQEAIVAGDRLVFARGAAALLPGTIQRKLAKLAGQGRTLLLHTDQLDTPWELLEIPAVYCRTCGQPVAAPPTCPHCHRLLLPDEFGEAECVCGQDVPDTLATMCAGCGIPVRIGNLVARPLLHLGLHFATNRLPKGHTLGPAGRGTGGAPGPARGLDPLRPLRVLLVENPTNLWYGNREADALEEFFRKNQRIASAVVLDRENARHDTIRRAIETRGPFDIIHFIGHAEFTPDDPGHSYLLLAGGGRLQLSEVPEVFGAAPARLVILNGCQTAVVRRAQNVQVGFPTAFLALGCQGFIGTLSPVLDPLAFHLAISLYHEILQGAPLAAGLWLAKRRLSRQVAAPGVRGAAELTPSATLGMATATAQPMQTYFAWAPYVSYGDASLQLREFGRRVTWRGLAAAAGEHAQRAMAGREPLAGRTCGFLPGRVHPGAPIWVELGTSSQAMRACAAELIAQDRHIVCLLELDRLDPTDRSVPIAEYIAHRLLARTESLEDLFPYIEQMTTDDSSFIVFITGLDGHPQPLEVLRQIEELCFPGQARPPTQAAEPPQAWWGTHADDAGQSGPAGRPGRAAADGPSAQPDQARQGRQVKIILSASPDTWKELESVAGPGLLSLVANLAAVRTRTRDQACARLAAWAEQQSQQELGLIPPDKWSAATSHLYVRRQLEDEILAFLRRGGARGRGFCVLGETGRGKTNLLCRLYTQLAAGPTDADGHVRVAVFTTARGLREAARDTGVRTYCEDALTRAALGKRVGASAGREARWARASRVLASELAGRALKLTLLIDGINEIGAQDGSALIAELTHWLADLRVEAPLQAFPISLSVIVSSRTLFWRTLWHGREVEHRRYFENLGLDTRSELEENLFDFELDSEAREAYERAALQPAWSELDEDFRQLCRTPFFLNILRTMAPSSGGVIRGTYHEVMQRYEASVLLSHRSDDEALRTSGLRRAVIESLVALLAGNPAGSEPVRPPDVASFDDLRRRLLDQHYDPESAHWVVTRLAEESVLETRGGLVRFAFDRFFDYLFEEAIALRSRHEHWCAEEWARTLAYYCRSEYHRTGVSAALARTLQGQATPAASVALIQRIEASAPAAFPLAYRQLVFDGIVAFGKAAPDQAGDVLAALYAAGGDILTVSTLACRVAAHPQVPRGSKEALLRVMGQMVNSFLAAHGDSRLRRTQRRNLINMIGDLGQAERGLDLVLGIMRYIFDIDPDTGALPPKLGLVVALLADAQLQAMLSRVRSLTTRRFTERMGRARIMTLMIFTAAITPSAYRVALRHPRVLTLLPWLPQTLRQLEIAFEILFRTIVLWFARRRSASDETFREQILVFESFFLRDVLGDLVDEIERRAENPAAQQEIIQNLAFLLTLPGLWPEFNRLFSYSEEGLDHLARVLREGGGPDLAELLGLFDIETPLSAVDHAVPRLRQLFEEPDSFRNYLGMLATIVQGTRCFAEVADMLWDILTCADDSVIRIGKLAVPRRAKRSREVFSIFTYMIRRTADRDRVQLERMIAFTDRVTEYLFAFDPEARELPLHWRAMLRTELFGHEDPFNPLLPLGVASQYRGSPCVSLGMHPNYVMELIDCLHRSRFPTDERYVLIDRILRECVPMAYFAPLPVISTIADFILKRLSLLRDEPRIRASLATVIRDLGHMFSGHLPKLFDNLQSEASRLEETDPWAAQTLREITQDLQHSAQAATPSPAEVEYLYHAIDVFGGHDLVTTVFIEYRRLCKVGISNLQRNIQEVQTAAELVQDFIATIIADLASPRNNFSILQMLYGEDTPATESHNQEAGIVHKAASAGSAGRLDGRNTASGEGQAAGLLGNPSVADGDQHDAHEGAA